MPGRTYPICGQIKKALHNTGIQETLALVFTSLLLTLRLVQNLEFLDRLDTALHFGCNCLRCYNRIDHFLRADRFARLEMRAGVAPHVPLEYFAPMPNPDPASIVLASASPRRSDLLTRESVAFEIIPANIPELPRAGERPCDLATRLATEKATAVAKRIGSHPARWVLGADTIVVIDESVLGKPTDADNAAQLLGQLKGRTHSVMTGFAWVNTRDLVPYADHVESRVTMFDVSEEAIRDYVATGEPMDKAGAYAVQGMGGKLVDRVDGSIDNVIGLPVENVLARLAELRGRE